MAEDLVITRNLTIPRRELRFRSSRSSGPGGQHVNTSSTRVELVFDVEGSPSLGPRQRAAVMRALANRIDSRGVLHLTSQAHRSQAANKEEVVVRFLSLMVEALRRRKKRRATAPTAASRKRRHDEKLRRGSLKRTRRRPDPERD